MKTIYCLNDDDDLLQIVRDVIVWKLPGTIVKTFQFSNELLKEFKSNPVPDLIITDYLRFQDFRSTRDLLEILRMDSRPKKPRIAFLSSLDDCYTYREIDYLIDIDLGQLDSYKELVAKNSNSYHL